VKDYASIINAVKPQKQTALYKVLGALYSLGALNIPVTTDEVTRTILLQFGQKGVLINLSAKLTQLKKYVRRESLERPIKWRLMPERLAKLNKLSGLDLSGETDSLEYLRDVGIICALEQPEFSAVVAATGGESAWRVVEEPRLAHVYRECELTTNSGKTLKVIGTTSSSMGLTAASIVTTQLIMHFRPRMILMIGIAAGTRDGKKQFGDVLVADPSIDYMSGKVVRAEGIRDFLPDPYPIGLVPRVRSVLRKYLGSNPAFAQIRSGWRGSVPSESNRLHLGPLGAADQVVDDHLTITELQRNWRKLIGVEMETYGVYRACLEAPDPKPRFISFKSVCDFAAEKGDSWQSYAAYVASEFAIRFLKAEWEGLCQTK